MDLIFLGTPAFAEPALHRLISSPHSVKMVITQPDKPTGRGQKTASSPVKVLAEKYNIPVRQPANLRKDPQLLYEMKALAPDLLITCAYGQILNQAVLDIPQIAVWNIHASLLPRWRGAAPINWSILSGDQSTGITIMQTELGLDTGPVLSQAKIPILPDAEAPTLTASLALLGADLLLQTIRDYGEGKIEPLLQIDAQATHAPKLNREMGRVSFKEQSAVDIERKVRALLPWPGACFEEGDQLIKIFKAQVIDAEAQESQPGAFRLIAGEGVWIQCNPGVLKLISLQPPNKAKMKGGDWYRGYVLRT